MVRLKGQSTARVRSASGDPPLGEVGNNDVYRSFVERLVAPMLIEGA